MNSPKSLSPCEVSGSRPAGLSGNTPTSFLSHSWFIKATDVLFTHFRKATHIRLVLEKVAPFSRGSCALC